MVQKPGKMGERKSLPSPSGDFTDDQGRLHRRENHTAYVTLEDAISGIRMVEEKFLSDKETELQRLESENYLLHKAREISGEATDIEKKINV